MDFLIRIEQLGFSSWVRESSSIFAYPSVLLLHTVGMALVVGVNAGFDLRILGVAPELRLAPMEKFFPVLWAGFWVNAATGTALLMADASTKLLNPVFYVKMVFIALALINLRMLRRRVFHDPQVDKRTFGTNAKVLAFTNLIFWLGAITAGRLLGYIGPVSGLN
jgi:hypothetical protein